MKEDLPSIYSLLLRLWEQISQRRRIQLLALAILMIIASIVEIISLATVLPFLGILTDPTRVFFHPLSAGVISKLGLNEPSEILLPVTIFFGIAAFTAGSIRFILLWAQTSLSHAIGADFSLAMYRHILYQPYSAHVQRNSSEVISGVSNKAREVVGSTLLPVMTIISSVMLLVAILFALVNIEPFITLIALVGFTAIYLSIIFITKKKLIENSKKISEGQSKVIKVLQEGLGGIRDVLLDGTQEVQCDLYQSVDWPTRKAMASVQIISVSPRYGVEAIGMVLIAILAYILTLRSGGVVSAIPILGVFALGAQRMLPILQQSYTGWASIRGGQASLMDALELLELRMPIVSDCEFSINFNSEINFKNVSFSYHPDGHEVLRDINLVIPKGARIGIVGSTGSGKSTFLDVIMGLLVPMSGEILVDGVKITEENRMGWQKHIAHVPQSIFLADTSIDKNIMLGCVGEEVDLVRARISATKAQLNEFVELLDQKYETIVGERGVRLSGGQRQRIGIARALYKQADFLILDEATSALDNETESKVMREVDSIGNKITVIIVAHRLSTLKNCDKIIEFKNGRINKVGTYGEIIGVGENLVPSFH